MIPAVSVVVATYNAPDLLLRLLQSLREQSLDDELYEVVIVNDGSTDHTEKALRAFCADLPNFRWFTQPNAGPARARNAGIRQTRGAYVAITDQDCIADKDWLKEIYTIFQENPDVLGIEGQTVSIPDQITPFTHQIVNLHGGMFATCNVAYRKSTLDLLNGFDEDFPYGHEDTELSLRVRNLGKTVFSERAKILHPPIPISFKKLVKQSAHWRNEFILYRKQPAFYKQYHRSPLYNILAELCVRQLFYRLREHLSYFPRSPFGYCKFAAALVLQRLYFMTLLPGYIVKYR